jgi:hypothetical protein
MVERGTHGDVLPGWPDAVSPPGSEDWEASAADFPVKFICSVRGMAAAILFWDTLRVTRPSDLSPRFDVAS